MEVCRNEPFSPYRFDKVKEDGYKSDIAENSRLTKIVAWHNVSRSFVLTVENDFKKNNIPIHTVYLNSPNAEKTLLKSLVNEGIKTVITIDRSLERKGRVSLQVFSSSGTVECSRYDRKSLNVTENTRLFIFNRIRCHLE